MCTLEEFVIGRSRRCRRLLLCDDLACKSRKFAERPITVSVEADDPPGVVLESGAVVYVSLRRPRRRPGPRSRK